MTFGFDRSGYSAVNVKKAQKLGVENQYKINNAGKIYCSHAAAKAELEFNRHSQSNAAPWSSVESRFDEAVRLFSAFFRDPALPV